MSSQENKEPQAKPSAPQTRGKLQQHDEEVRQNATVSIQGRAGIKRVQPNDASFVPHKTRHIVGKTETSVASNVPYNMRGIVDETVVSNLSNYTRRIADKTAATDVSYKMRGIVDQTEASDAPHNTRGVVNATAASDVSYVMFHVHTGGLNYRHHDLLQIAAVCGHRVFNIYITPTGPVPAKASAVNHLTVRNGQLCYKGQPVRSIDIKQALKQFVDFLTQIHRPVLVGHYAKKFDLPFVRFHLERYDLWERFCACVMGYVDTWQVFRAEHPDLPSYKQVDLVARFKGLRYEAKTGLKDVRALQKLADVVKNKLWQHRFGASDIELC